jgi:hypothetical protein
MVAIEGYIHEFRDRTPFGRRQALSELETLRTRLLSVSNDTYLISCFTRMKAACDELARLSVDKDVEARQLANAFIDLNLIRDRLEQLDLLTS